MKITAYKYTSMNLNKEKPRAIIIESDEKSRDILVKELSSNERIDLSRLFPNTKEALQEVQSNRPYLIFIDLDIPGDDGFDFINTLNNLHLHPCVVYMSGNVNMAVQAIRHKAFDFLHTPLKPEEVLQCLNRFSSYAFQCCFTEKIDTILECVNPNTKIRFNTAHGFILLSPCYIVYCLADWNYTEIWLTRNRKEVVPLNIGKVEKMLPDRLFVRISRSVIINKSFIERLNRRNRMVTIVHGDSVQEFKVSLERVKDLGE